MDSGSPTNIVKYIYEILGQVVILPIPLASKGPKFKGWDNTTWEDTQTEQYQRRLMMAVQQGGNLGILLGESSGHLVAIDMDEDAEVERFFQMCPWAKDTMITRGAHGCQVWFFMDGEYPPERIILKKTDGAPSVEFRGGGGVQSVVWGLHKNKVKRYEMDGEPIRIEYTDLAEWMASFRAGASDDTRKHDYKRLEQWKGCDIRDLNLLELLNEAEIRYKKVDSQTFAIRCPWINEHSTETGERDTTVWQYPLGSRFPAFRCLHAHCEDRWLANLLEWVDTQYPGIVARHCRGRDVPRIEVVTYNEVFTERPGLPKELIQGLLYAETKMMIAGSPKIGKTWMTMDLGLDMVLGDVWFGFDTCQNMRILYLNMEMPRAFFDARLYDIEVARGMQEMPRGAFNVIHLRGIGLDQHLRALEQVCDRCGPFDIIFIDPMYKILGDRDENSATEVADLLRDIDRLAYKASAAVVEVHHFAKGDATLRQMGDRASGSGVWYRDADVMMTIMPSKSKAVNEAKIEIKARLVPVIEPFGVRWEDYRWRRDEGVDIDKKTGPERVAPRQTQSDILLQILQDYPDGLTHGEWKKIAEVTFSIQASSFNYALKNIEDKLILDGKKYKIKPENT